MRAGTEKFSEAVAAYREALKELTRQRAPLQWAATQMNLGKALGMLGEREGGTQKLSEAVGAFREALKEFTHERAPRDNEAATYDLNVALYLLQERERK